MFLVLSSRLVARVVIRQCKRRTKTSRFPSRKQNQSTPNQTMPLGEKLWQAAPYVACAVLVPVAIPVALGMVGFTGSGIAAGSIAAKMMSISAVANGGGVAGGSIVAVCQSVGAAGLGVAGKIAAATVGAGTVAAVKRD